MSDFECENSLRENLTPFLLQVAAVLDVMGEASAKAQGLKTAITSGICQSFKEYPGKKVFVKASKKSHEYR